MGDWQLGGQSLAHLLGQSVVHSVTRLLSQSLSCSVSHSVNWSVSCSVGQSVSQSVSPSVGQSVSQSVRKFSGIKKIKIINFVQGIMADLKIFLGLVLHSQSCLVVIK